MWSNPASSLDDSTERHTWEKLILMLVFHLLCLLSSLKEACRVWLWSRYLKAAAEKHTHTHKSSNCNRCPSPWLMSANTEPSPQCQHKGLPGVFRWPLVLLHFLSLFVHPPILFPQAGTGPVWALTWGITSAKPTQIISNERVIAGKSKR